MDVSLVMFKTDGTRRDFPLSRESVVVGRTNEADLRIPLPSVSRKHCEFAFDGEVIRLTDLGSSNGTLHNSSKVSEAVLGAGDRIDVGPVSFFVVVDGLPDDLDALRAETAPVATEAEADAVTLVDQPIPTADTSPSSDVLEAEPVLAETDDDALAELVADVADSPAEAAAELVAEPNEQVAPVAPPKPAPVAATPQPNVPPKPAAKQPKPAPASTPQVAEEVDLEDALAQAAKGDAGSADAPAPVEAVEFEDPIAALEALAALENQTNNEFEAFFNDDDSSGKGGKKS